MADERFHKNHGPFSLGAIADRIGCIITDAEREIIITDVASLQDAQNGHICFLDNPKYRLFLPQSRAAACIMRANMTESAPAGMTCLLTDHPYKAYALAAQMFYPPVTSVQTAIHPTAVVSDKATIGHGTIIEANSVIADGVAIGRNCHIGANVTISHALIGDHVRIHNGARIGQDGFGFALDPAGYIPVPQLGRVVIDHHVNIGANACIDRGAGPDTVIGEGAIIDNLVQIAHNVRIGKGCVIVAQTGISGSTVIEDYCVFGGQSGVAGHLHIGRGAQIGAQSGVTKDVKSGEKLMGFPARPIREFWREMAQIKKLLSK